MSFGIFSSYEKNLNRQNLCSTKRTVSNLACVFSKLSTDVLSLQAQFSSSWHQIIILFCTTYQIESLFSLAYSDVWEKQLNSYHVSNDEKTDQVALCSPNIVTFCTYSLFWYSAVVSTIFDQSYFLPLKWPFHLTKHTRLTKVLGLRVRFMSSSSSSCSSSFPFQSM